MYDYHERRLNIEREKLENRDRHERRKHELDQQKLRLAENRDKEKARQADLRQQERFHRQRMREEEEEEQATLDYQIHAENLILRDKHFRMDMESMEEREVFQAQLAIFLQERKEMFEREMVEKERSSAYETALLHGENAIRLASHQAHLDMAKELFTQGFRQFEYQRRINESAVQTLGKMYDQAVSSLVYKANTKALLEKQKAEHEQALKEMKVKHTQELIRMTLDAELRKGVFTHEQIVLLSIRILERALALKEKEVDREQVAAWVREFEKEMPR